MDRQRQSDGIEHREGDTAVTEVHLQTGGGSIRILFASVYLPYDSVEAPPTTATRRTVEYGVNRGKHLILGLDANTHHVAWGSTNTNRRDHNYISFHIKSTCVKETYWNPRRTDWEKFRKELANNLESLDPDSEREVEGMASAIQSAILNSYTESCPESVKRTNKYSCWWNRKLETQRRNIRRLYNQCKRTGNWDSYAKALTEYSKAVREAKRSSWRNFCQDIESVPDCAKLQ
nr:unnamed protein product [Callosobruchus analis]